MADQNCQSRNMGLVLGTRSTVAGDRSPSIVTPQLSRFFLAGLCSASSESPNLDYLFAEPSRRPLMLSRLLDVQRRGFSELTALAGMPYLVQGWTPFEPQGYGAQAARFLGRATPGMEEGRGGVIDQGSTHPPIGLVSRSGRTELGAPHAAVLLPSANASA